jgi:hypothetical protein
VVDAVLLGDSDMAWRFVGQRAVQKPAVGYRKTRSRPRTICESDLVAELDAGAAEVQQLCQLNGVSGQRLYGDPYRVC